MNAPTLQQLNSVFHAYDIRGRDPEELNEEFYEILGKAFTTFIKGKKVAIGYDFRRSSKKYHDAMIRGITSLGCDVVDIGEVATEMIYYAAGSDQTLDGAATITASHNPAGWNGCKMVAKDVTAISEDYGLKEIKELMLKNEFQDADKKGEVTNLDIFPDYKKKVLSFLEGVQVKPLKIVVDAGNGIGGKIFDYIFGELPVTVTKMYFELDDTFPNHIPNPIELENVQELMEVTKKQQADIGISIDGDGDRSFFVDNKGRNPDGVYIGSIFTEHFLKKYPGGKIILDPRVVGPVDDQVEKFGGIGMSCKAGHSFFKQMMKKEGAVFGSENSSHFFFKDFYYADSGMITIAIMLKLLSEGLDFDERLDYLYEKYPKSGEVNYQVDDTKTAIKKVEDYFKTNYQDLEYDYLDGVSVTGPDWRFNLRPSNTQPLIRLNVEAKSKDKVIEKFQEIEKVINGKRDNMPVLEELR